MMPRSHRPPITSAPPPMRPRMGESGGWPHRLPAVPTWRARHLAGAHRCSMSTRTGNHPPPAMSERAACVSAVPRTTDAAMPYALLAGMRAGACPLSAAGGSGSKGWEAWPLPEILDGCRNWLPATCSVRFSLSAAPGGVPAPGPWHDTARPARRAGPAKPLFAFARRAVGNASLVA